MFNNTERPAVVAFVFMCALAPEEVSAQDLAVCDRTVQVRDALEAASGGTSCAVFTVHHLREITTLDLSNQAIATLRAGDFNGLVRLETLDLSGNVLTSLPRRLFDELYFLKTLNLHGNQLATVPDQIFDQLFLLEELTLHDNRFTSLPADLFDDFSRLAGIAADGAAPDNSGEYPRIQRFLDRHDITSPEEFIAALPDLYLQRFVLMYASESPARPHVSPAYPRVISWGADGHIIFSWNTNPYAPSTFRDSVEFLRQDEFAWTAGVIDFSGSAVEITEPALCQSCHGPLNKPLWDEFYDPGRWEGSEYQDARYETYIDGAHEFIPSIMRSENPRLEPLDFTASAFLEANVRRSLIDDPGGIYYVTVVEEAGAVWSWRHAEVLFRELERRRDDFDDLAEAVMCGETPGHSFPVLHSFDPSEHHLHFSALEDLVTDEVGRITNVNEDTVKHGYIYGDSGGAPATLPGAVNFLLLADLFERDKMARHLYRSLSNEETVPSRTGAALARLHFPAGSATAEDELIHKLRLHFGEGGATALGLRARQNVRNYGQINSAAFWQGHSEFVSSRVCDALRGNRPRDLAASVNQGDVELSWSTPTYDEGAVTGYEITRSVESGEGELVTVNTGSTEPRWTDESPAAGVYDYAVRAVYDGLYTGRMSESVRVTVEETAGTLAPAVTGATTFTVMEGDTSVGTLAARDADTDPGDLTWSLSGGADRASFTLSAAGVLAFASAKDFESPDDTDGDGTYEVSVQVSDGTLTGTANLNITLSNRNEAPTADAGADQHGVEAGATVNLSGTGIDPDAGETLRYRWTQASGTTVTLSAADAAATSFTAPADLTEDETLRFTLRVTDGAGLYAEDEIAVAVEASRSEPELTARVENLPNEHDGSSSFTFELHFSEAVSISYRTLRDTSFEVTGGTVTEARRMVRFSNLSWEIAVTPAGDADVRLVLAANRSCETAGAICTGDGKRLSNRLALTVAGPPSTPASLTARVEGVPESHDGSPFRFRLYFSENVVLSYRTLRDTAFTVTGASITQARRLSPPSNIGWEITVAPGSTAGVSLVLVANRECNTTGAICTAGGARLSNRLQITVPAGQ